MNKDQLNDCEKEIKQKMNIFYACAGVTIVALFLRGVVAPLVMDNYNGRIRDEQMNRVAVCQSSLNGYGLEDKESFCDKESIKYDFPLFGQDSDSAICKWTLDDYVSLTGNNLKNIESFCKNLKF